MRRYAFVITLAAAWTAIPSAGTVIGAASLATAALLPGWRFACGRDPRCFERGEYRRQMARLRVQSAGVK